MAQFYFLSVLFNILTGLIIVYGKRLVPASKENLPSESADDDFSQTDSEFESESTSASASTTRMQGLLGNFDSRSFRLVLGVLCMFVGLMKFLSVFRNDVPVIGDLFPAIAGLAGGASLLLEYYTATSSVGLELPEWVTKLFVDSRKYVGVACLIAGLLHFVCPQVMLL